MEPRIAALEANVAHLQVDLSDLKSDVRVMRADISDLKTGLASLTVAVSHLPTKEYIGKTVRNWMAVAVGAVALLNAALTWGPKLLQR